ncbi:MAG: NDP-sugar synthase [Patulibacter sp.]|nr:NDP-sugar synthase [Patulibacter sp.]
MQVVILVGGKGTRLRPLTATRPKPNVPIVDRPFLAYALEWVADHGMTDVVLCCGFKSDAMVEEFGDGSRFGVSITWVFEPEPRGTAGGLKMAEEHLDDRFLLLNGDVLTDMDLTAQVAAHERSGARGTLALVPVADPSAYGLVRLNDDSSVAGFLEKPEPDEIDTDLISAGAYVLERDVLDMIPPGREVSIEREVWPRLVGDGLFGFVHRDAYWMDIGTPERYIQAVADVLSGAVETRVLRRLRGGPVAPGAVVDPAATVAPDALVEEGSRVAAGAVIGSGTVVGAGAIVGANAVLERSILLPGAIVESDARLRDFVAGERSRVPAGTTVTGPLLVADDETLAAAGESLVAG